MADEKISEFTILSNPIGTDLLPIVKSRTGQTKVNHRISLDDFFDGVASNTQFNSKVTVKGNLTLTGSNTHSLSNANFTNRVTIRNLIVTSNGIILKEHLTPANNSVPVIEVGKVFYDHNYLYIKVGNNLIKRVQLDTF